MERQTVYQTAFAGMATDQIAGDIVDKCRAMLSEEPATREDYERAWLRYLARYHDLDAALRTGRIAGADSFLDFLRISRAPGFRTIANRCQELIRADADLQPKAEIMDRRQRQSKQGRVR